MIFFEAIGEKKYLYTNMVTKLFVPPAGLPNYGLRREAQFKTLACHQEEVPKRCSSCEVPRATERIWIMQV